jgi:hypothetical protein
MVSYEPVPSKRDQTGKSGMENHHYRNLRAKASTRLPAINELSCLNLRLITDCFWREREEMQTLPVAPAGLNHVHVLFIIMAAQFESLLTPSC